MAFESDYDSDMSYDDAAAALQASLQDEESEAPVEQAKPVAESETPQGVEEQVEEQPSEDSEEEAFFNPDELPEELLPAWRQLQADYTRKTQALAEQRRQLEQYGDPEEVTNAVELYHRLSDPENWVQLHGELTQALVEAGYTFEEAQEVAQSEMEIQADEMGIGLDDPEIAPLQNEIAQLRQYQQEQQAYLSQLEEERQFFAQQQEAERAHNEYVAYMQGQVSDLRKAYPHYDNDDLQAVVELGSFYNDDLTQAAQAYEAHVARRMERYLQSKAGAQSPTHGAPKGAGSDSEVPPVEPDELSEDFENEMVDLFRELQARGEIDF